MIKFGKKVLIAFIFGLLIVPLFHMNTSEITEQENRTLAKFPEIKKKDKPNYEFGKEFESWLGDRFWGRNYLIDFKTAVEYILEENYTKNNVVKGKDGWLFKNLNKNSLNVSNKAMASIQKLKKYCDSKNIKLILVLAPYSNDIYDKYYPLPYEKALNKESMEFYKRTSTNIINPILALTIAQRFKTFFKKDHHWTDYGALITYKEFEKKLKKIYPNYRKLDENNFNISFVDQKDYKRDGVSINSFCKGLALPDFLCKSEKYPLYQYKNNIIHKTIQGKWKYGVNKYTNNNGYPLRVALLGKSQIGSFKIFLTSAIQDVITVDMNHLYVDSPPSFFPYKDLIENFKPEILVVLLPGIKLDNFMDGF